jgi:hypothetical protein
MATATQSASKPKAKAKGRGVQLVVFVVAAVVWSLIGSTATAAFLVAYVLALILVNTGLSWFGLQSVAETLTLPQRRLLLVGLAIVPVFVFLRTFANTESIQVFSNAQVRSADKLFLERTPSIAPSFLCSDQPQRFFRIFPRNTRGHRSAPRPCG